MQAKLPLSTIIKKRLDAIAQKRVLLIGLMVLGMFLGLLISFILPKQYRAISNIYFKYNSVNSASLSNNGSLENEIKFLKSKNLVETTIDKIRNKGYELDIDDVLGSIEVLEDEAAKMVELRVTADDAEKSADIANSIVQTYLQKSNLDSRTAFINVIRSITERHEVLQDEIRKDIANNQRTQPISLTIDHEQVIGRIAEFESELEVIELNNQFYLNQLNSLQDILENKYSDISGEILFINNEKLISLRTKLERLETKKILSGISSKLNNFRIEYNWGDIQDLNDLKATQKLFNLELEKFIDGLSQNRKIEDLDYFKVLTEKFFENQIKITSIDLTKSVIFNTLNKLEDSFNRIPFSLIDVARQIRVQRFNNKLALKLKSRLNNLRQREKDFFAEIDSIREASVPSTYFSPNTTLNVILGGLLGLVIGLFSVLTSNKKQIEQITNAADLEEAGFKIISQIPSVPTGFPLLFDTLNQSEKDKLDPRILNSFGSIEAFLKYGSLDKFMQTILFTSDQNGEGKSLIASNTAIALANSGNKVLLIDLNLKFPRLNKYFQIKSTPSLAHFLFRKRELNEIIRNTHNSNLDIITCIEFPQNPAVIITSERMRNFMEEVKGGYDYIIYDACSLSALKETAEIAKDIDEVVLIARSNKTKLSEMLSADSVLKENGVTELNVVLNDVNF